jgi:hypothetical protein
MRAQASANQPASIFGRLGPGGHWMIAGCMRARPMITAAAVCGLHLFQNVSLLIEKT